jgi:hypothetical protein
MTAMRGFRTPKGPRAAGQPVRRQSTNPAPSQFSGDQTPESVAVYAVVRRLPIWNDLLASLTPLIDNLDLGIEISADAALADDRMRDAIWVQLQERLPALFGIAAPRGSNQPPEPLSPEAMLELLRERHGKLSKRQADLLESAKRFHARFPTIADEDTAGRATTFVSQLKAAIDAAETAREAEKKPWLDLGRTVDAFFNVTLKAPLEKQKTDVEAKQLAFARVLADRRRAAAAAEAARAQDEARKIADQAATSMSPDALDEAASAAAQAADLARQADARTATHSRVTGGYGATASIVTRWKIRAVADWHGKLAMQYLMPDQDALNFALRQAPRGHDGRPILEIAGAELLAEESMGNRG